jgi:hypothetical protein
MTGAWPPRYLQIEHRDSNPSNNSWANLFAVPDAKNKQNLNDRLRKDNRSGCRGVSQRPDGRWHARITVDGRTILLGDYIDLEQAVMVRKNAERRYLDHDRLPLS